MTIQNVVSDNDTADFVFPASVAVSRGDLLYWDSVGHTPLPLTSKATLATEALDQADVAAKFLGVSWDVRLASEATSTTTSDKRVVQLEGIFDCDCPSQTFNPGDLVGATWNGGTALANQFVTKVNNIALAIGVVYKYYGTAVTTVRVRLIGQKGWNLEDAVRLLGSEQGVGATVLSDAAQVLTVSSNPFLSMVPTTARNVTLPVEAQAAGLIFYFTNNSAGANSVTFLGSAGGSIKGNGVVPQNKTGIFWSDGTNWNGSVSA